MGLKKINSVWQYADGSKPIDDFWAPEPSEPNGDGNCVEIYVPSGLTAAGPVTFHRNDLSCGVGRPIICEYNLY